MQVTPSGATRPAATAQAPHSDVEPDGGESFAQMLSAPPEAPSGPKGTATARNRLQPKAEATRPAEGGTASHKSLATVDRNTDTSEGADAHAKAAGARENGGGGEDAALRDWLATLIQLPASPAATPALPAAGATEGPLGKPLPDSLQGSAPDANAVPATSTRATPWAALGSAEANSDTALQDGPAAPAADTPPGEADRRRGAHDDAADVGTADSRTHAANLSHRGKDAAHDEARDAAADRAAALQAGAGADPAAGAGQAEATALAVAAQTAPRAFTSAGSAGDPGAPPLAANPLVNDRPGVQDAAPVAVNVPLPLDDPRFAHALGAQVSLLARDGVHEASLQLNPAELGPVSVQIVLDGTQARVEFGADMAHTREVIERSLPELAAALRDAGLTLSGGSVSQHQAGRGERQGEPDGQRGRGLADRADRNNGAVGEPLAAPARRWVRTGGIDLYA